MEMLFVEPDALLESLQGEFATVDLFAERFLPLRVVSSSSLMFACGCVEVGIEDLLFLLSTSWRPNASLHRLHKPSIEHRVRCCPVLP